MLRDQHLKIFKDLGYDTYNNSYEDIVEEVIHELIRLKAEVEETEYERFKREIKRLMKPTN